MKVKTYIFAVLTTEVGKYLLSTYRRKEGERIEFQSYGFVQEGKESSVHLRNFANIYIYIYIYIYLYIFIFNEF